MTAAREGRRGGRPPRGAVDAAVGRVLARFARVRVLVAGDLMLDHFVWGKVERISPEAPVPVVQVTDESRRLGGAANVMHNVRALGGQVLACVDSLTFGMALLAEQHRWPHLVDVPNADVVLIPWPDGTITRCYGAEQLRELFTGGGLEVSWIRPRTVLSPQTVAYLLARDPASFGDLVNAELHARSDDAVGAQLIACAVKRVGTTPLHPPAREGAAPP